MDRNTYAGMRLLVLRDVATREGGVDRNNEVTAEWHVIAVATREGGVDRNFQPGQRRARFNASPPARVAWIETINFTAIQQVTLSVATREGGVDRNFHVFSRLKCVIVVATREGGVDRNRHKNSAVTLMYRRHPRGWRG